MNTSVTIKDKRTEEQQTMREPLLNDNLLEWHEANQIHHVINDDK